MQAEGGDDRGEYHVNPLETLDSPVDEARDPEGREGSPRGRQRPRRGASPSGMLWVGGGAVVVVALAAALLLFSTGAFGSADPPPAAPAGAPAGLVVSTYDLPSPYVLVDGSSTYLYTGGIGVDDTPHVPVRPFSSLSHLPARSEAMPALPRWSWGWIWTVDVVKAATGYAMWFTTQDPAVLNPGGVADQCIGNATSSSPTGPFTPSAVPVICQTWGSIDPRITTAPDGTMWLIWKSDLNADHRALIPTTIWEQQLAPNGITLLGTPHQIATSTQPWEGGLAESPDMVDLGGTYYLFFSGNSSLSPSNGVGMMTCDGIEGPCHDTRSAPLIASNSQGQGPGEESLFQQDGITWLLYSPNAIFGKYLFRPMAVARVAVGPSGPYVAQFDGAVPGT